MTPADMIDAIPRIASEYDEPFGNSSAAASYFCALRAKASGVDVLLGGDGGDELFAGNERYLSQRVFERYQCVPAFLRKGLLEPAVFGLPWGERTPLVAKARNYIRYANTPLPDRLQSWNWMERSDLSASFTADFLGTVDSGLPLALMRDAYDRTDSDSMLQRMMKLDLQITLADNDLPKVNRTCEMAGVRVKYPFLDDEVVALSARIPPEVLLGGNELRHFYKQAFADYLPQATLTKSKHGFGLPFDNWAREDPAARDLIRDCLNDFKTRGYMKPAFVDRVFEDQQGGDGAGAGAAAWDIVLLELWLKSH